MDKTLVSKIDNIGSNPIFCVLLKRIFYIYFLCYCFLFFFYFFIFIMVCKTQYYWNNLFFKFRTYNFKIKGSLLRVKTKTKFFKKVIKKSRTTRIIKVLKLNINFNIFTNTPPISTILNLIGVNTQNFVEDLNKSFLNFYFVNVPITLIIFIRADLSYSLNLNLNLNYVIKNFNSFFLLKNSSEHFLFNFFRKTNIPLNSLVRLENETILGFYRFYTFEDLFFLIYFIYIYQFISFMSNYNILNEKVFMLNVLKCNVDFESLVKIIIGVLKSYNLTLLHLKSK